jgi:hypothetical protein
MTDISSPRNLRDAENAIFQRLSVTAVKENGGEAGKRRSGNNCFKQEINLAGINS